MSTSERRLNDKHPKYEEFMQKVDEELARREKKIQQIYKKYEGKHDIRMATECNLVSRDCNREVGKLKKEYDFLYKQQDNVNRKARSLF